MDVSRLLPVLETDRLRPDLPLLPSGKPDQRALRQASVAVAHSGA